MKVLEFFIRSVVTVGMYLAGYYSQHIKGWELALLFIIAFLLMDLWAEIKVKYMK